jgi:putative ABC transport system permease protein
VLVSSGGSVRRTATVVVVDAAAFERVAQHSGVDAQLPPALASARRAGNDTVAAVVSSDVAADPGDEGRAETEDGLFKFTVAAVADGFPGLDSRVTRFIILPWQALPQSPSGRPFPNRFLIAGHAFNVDTLHAVGDEGQRALPSGAAGLAQPTEVTTRAERREAMESTGANQLLTFAFVVGTAGGVVLALLAVGFTVLADANSRGRALSRLRTMGLTGRQGRRLLAYELLPLLGVAVLAGAVVGVLLPRLLGPSLGLDAFTAGTPARTYLDPLLVAGLLGLVAVAVAAALGFESLVRRRMRVGEVLRLGEEN